MYIPMDMCLEIKKDIWTEECVTIWGKFHYNIARINAWFLN